MTWDLALFILFVIIGPIMALIDLTSPLWRKRR